MSLVIDNRNAHIAVQVNDPAHPCNRVRQIETRSHVRERQNGGIFNDGTAINFGVPLHRAAGGVITAPERMRAMEPMKAGARNTSAFFQSWRRAQSILRV